MLMNTFRKHIKLIPDYVSLAVKRESEYKAGFYTFIFNQAIGAGVWLLFWKILIGKVGAVGHFDFPHMVMLTGFATINMGMWFMFSFIWRLPREVITGQLNCYLIKPVHPFIHMIMRRLNLRAIPRVGIGLTIVILSLIHFEEISYSPGAIIIAALISLFSFLTTFLPFAMVCMSVFWIGRAEFLRDLFIEFFLFQNYPLSEFPGSFIVFFSAIIPLIFASTVPVLVLTKFTQTQALGLLAAQLVIITVQIFLFRLLWNKGLKRYESYGG
ncbi:MAG: ABC-2 family transporter protein [Phycisphaerae bacterium]|nr:ABC-2 family transporter protein [Phycisphaerae bacterium]